MGSSVQMQSDNPNDTSRSNNQVARIADDFLDGLANEMGVKYQPLSNANFSQNGSFIQHQISGSRKGTFQSMRDTRHHN